MKKMYRKSHDQVLKELDTKAQGLTREEAAKRLSNDGPNELIAQKKKSFIVQFLMQFTDILIIILIIAAIISVIVDDESWVEAIIIMVVVMANAIIGVTQESKAEKALEALKKLSSPLCKVIRDGNAYEIESSLLVKGDIILVEAGDFIPADARIIESSNLLIDESSLTGESVAVEKNVKEIKDEALSLGDRKNMLFSSTFATYGRCVAVVTATAMDTEIGKIAGMLSEEDNTNTPLQDKLNQIGKVIGIGSIAICVIVFLLLMVAPLREGTLDKESFVFAFKTAVALAVAAIPEGLAAIVTIVLAIGVTKMANEKAIIKKLPAVETLGCTSVVCSDKTGTLTQNKMTVLKVFTSAIQDITDSSKEAQEMLGYFALCCDAKISFVDGEEKRVGDPTETALIEANNKYGSIKTEGIVRYADLSFDSERKLMTVIVKYKGKIISITKGAPDVLLKHCVDNPILKKADDANKRLANSALRILGVGIREWDKIPSVISSEILENDLKFIGLVGMIDPARDEVKQAIKEAKIAGIKTVMITGDHVITAKAIATELDILGPNDIAISSDELNKISDEDLRANIEKYAVFARVNPADKVRIVDAWQSRDMVVAMTGDGVNDSPALKRADIGCAMGITGTDVAKEAGDMILVDDNFATIIKAVKEGRGIYANIKKCVRYLLSCNIGEVLTILSVALLVALGVLNESGLNPGEHMIPLVAIHLLWVNLVTDALPAFGLGMELPEDEVMLEKPRSKKEGFFANKIGTRIILEGLVVGAVTLTAFLIGYHNDPAALVNGQTMAFITLSVTQLFHSFNVRSENSIFSKKTFANKFLIWSFVIGFVLQLGVVYTPWIQDIFRVHALSFTNLMICMGLSVVLVVVSEIYKLIKRINVK